MQRPKRKAVISREQYDAVLLDLDGVITDTAGVHAACWKQMFDEYLQKRATERGEAFRPFDIATDYRLYVDGKPRYDGVRDFLGSRAIRLPEGSRPPTCRNSGRPREPQERPGQQDHRRKRRGALRGKRRTHPSAARPEVQNRRRHVEPELHGCLKGGQVGSLLRCTDRR